MVRATLTYEDWLPERDDCPFKDHPSEEWADGHPLERWSAPEGGDFTRILHKIDFDLLSIMFHRVWGERHG